MESGETGAGSSGGQYKEARSGHRGTGQHGGPLPQVLWVSLSGQSVSLACKVWRSAENESSAPVLRRDSPESSGERNHSTTLELCRGQCIIIMLLCSLA